MFTGVRAVLFDLDGTLIDRDAALRAWLRRRAGLGPEIAGLLELDRADHCSLVQLGVELQRLRPGLARDAAALVERIRAELPSFIVADPALPRALERLRAAGLRLALISNGGPAQRRKLAAANLPERLFAAVMVSGEFGRAKPDPAIFAATLAALELGPGEALMIGDAPIDDIAGAAALGVRTCWIARGRSYPDGVATPTFVAEELAEALARLVDRDPRPSQGKSKSRVSASRTSDE